ncbi:MAG: NAD(P)H-dependent flavin oxidoreductase [Rhodospirillaceae bacterium]
MVDRTSSTVSVGDRIAAIKKRLVVPAFQAPMFLVSGPELVIAACKAGVVGSFPTMNARPIEILESWFEQITAELKEAEKGSPGKVAPWAANLIVHRSFERFEKDLALVQKYKPDIVITALGSPRRVIKQVHDYGGLVFADVNSVAYAKKAAEAGADGLVLVSSGAGGHTGFVTGFSFLPAVRSFFDGPIILGGGIVDGQGIRAAEVLGADFAYLGTRFIPTNESMASDKYKQMLVDSTEEDIFITAHFTGVPANYLRPSIENAGLNPDNLGVREEKRFDSRAKNSSESEEPKAWRDIFSAGQGLRTINTVQSVAALVSDLKKGYDAAKPKP